MWQIAKKSDKAVNAKKDKELQAQDLEAMVKDAYSESIVTLKFLKKQIEVGVKMLEAAERVRFLGFPISTNYDIYF